MNKINLAYLAGVVDSDGSISIAISRWRTKLGRNPAYQPILAIGMCDPEPLQLAKELFGGHIRIEKARGEHRRCMYHWNVGNRIAIRAIEAIYPYLLIKRKQAEIIFALRDLKNRGRQCNTYLAAPHIRRLKPQVLEEMNSLTRQIRERNDSRFPIPLG